MVSCDKSWETESHDSVSSMSDNSAHTYEMFDDKKKKKKKPGSKDKVSICDSIELMKMHNTDEPYTPYIIEKNSKKYEVHTLHSQSISGSDSSLSNSEEIHSHNSSYDSYYDQEVNEPQKTPPRGDPNQDMQL